MYILSNHVMYHTVEFLIKTLYVIFFGQSALYMYHGLYGTHKYVLHMCISKFKLAMPLLLVD